MGTGRSAFQVGILVIIAAAMFIGGYYFFKRDQLASNSYRVTIEFTDAEGVDKGSDVDFSGVPVGQVEDIQLSPSGTALVRARLRRAVRIPTSATITIVSSLLGSRATVEILPSKLPPGSLQTYYAPGATIVGSQGMSLASLQGQAGGLIDSLKVTANKTNKLIDQLTVTAQSANRLINNPTMKNSLAATMDNIHDASGQALQIATELHRMVGANGRILTASLGNVESSTQDLKNLTRANGTRLNDMIANLDASSDQVKTLVTHANRLLDATSATLNKGDAVGNLTATLANLKTATEKLNSIEDDVRSITGDKTVQDNLKTTVKNVAQASGQTNELIARLDALSGGHPSHAPQISSQLVFWEDFRQPKFRTDFDIFFPYGSQNFIRAGVYDLTESNGLNFQVGQRYNDRVSGRAGVYDNKVGVGFDYSLFGLGGGETNKDLFTADLYNPNNLTLDLRQRLRIGNGTAMWLGMENIPKSPTVAAGFELSH